MVFERVADSETTFAVIFGTSLFFGSSYAIFLSILIARHSDQKPSCPRPPCWISDYLAIGFLVTNIYNIDRTFLPGRFAVSASSFGRDDLELFFITLAAILVFLIFPGQSVAYRRFSIVLAHSVFGSLPCRTRRTAGLFTAVSFAASASFWAYFGPIAFAPRRVYFTI